MTKKIIYSLVLVLLVLLPVQNILGQISVHLLGLPSIFLLWKEAVVLILSLFFLKEIIFGNTNLKKSILPIFIYFLTVLIVLFSSFYNNISLSQIVLGFRFELFWLGFFAIILAWSFSSNFNKYSELKNFGLYGVYIGFILVALVSLSSLAFGQEKVLLNLGFQQQVSTQDLNQFISSPLCNPVDAGSTICRLSAGFSSPNHFAGYLLLVLPVFLVNSINFIQTRRNSKTFSESVYGLLHLIFLLLNIIFIYLTVSRFAWVGLAIILAFSLVLFLHKKFEFFQKHYNFTKVLLVSFLVFPVLILSVLMNVNPETIKQLNLPQSVYKPASSDEHYRLTNASVDILQKNQNIVWFGYGLGQSGPANKPDYQDPAKTSIISQNIDIADKYLLLPHRLAIPENWFLQVWLNGGIFYLGFYLILVSLVFRKFVNELKNFGVSCHSDRSGGIPSKINVNYTNIFFGLGFFGIIIGNLFLHIWENQTVAIYWSLIYILWESYNKEHA